MPPEAGGRGASDDSFPAPGPTPLFARTGIGYDSHRFAPGDHVTLGGVRIPADVALLGHSDADAVAHAVTDAILGAAAAGDIGALFPDSDEGNRGRNSIEMLRLAVGRVKERGFTVHQIDVVVIAEKPKLGPHRARVQSCLADALGLPPSFISVKGKTNEGMGWIGRGEGLACIAVATVVPLPGS